MLLRLRVQKNEQQQHQDMNRIKPKQLLNNSRYTVIATVAYDVCLLQLLIEQRVLSHSYSCLSSVVARMFAASSNFAKTIVQHCSACTVGYPSAAACSCELTDITGSDCNMCSIAPTNLQLLLVNVLLHRQRQV
jgi:hypothetical protein